MARLAQSLARHATSFAAGRAKGGTSRGKLGTTRDIFFSLGDKKEHVTCKIGHDTRHLLQHARQMTARDVQRRARYAPSFAAYATKEGTTRANDPQVLP